MGDMGRRKGRSGARLALSTSLVPCDGRVPPLFPGPRSVAQGSLNTTLAAHADFQARCLPTFFPSI